MTKSEKNLKQQRRDNRGYTLASRRPRPFAEVAAAAPGEVLRGKPSASSKTPQSLPQKALDGIYQVLAASDLGFFQASATSISLCADLYRDFIRGHSLGKAQISFARVYAANYRQVANITYEGKIRRTR